MLRAENISRTFRIAGKRKMILDNIDFEIKKGEMAVMTGSSGCGKTTLLNILSGLVAPEKGSIYLGGKKLHTFLDILSSRARNRKIGFVFQTFRLLSNETVLSNVLLPARICGKADKKVRERADFLLNELGILEFKHMRAGLLSGGQKQRAAIARALINDPEVILADEPTANLDKETAADICKILKDLTKDNRAVLVVSHQPELIEKADKIFKLKDGKLEVPV